MLIATSETEETWRRNKKVRFSNLRIISETNMLKNNNQFENNHVGNLVGKVANQQKLESALLI